MMGPSAVMEWERPVPKLVSKIVSKAGLALGVSIMAGSVLAGAAVAMADRGGPARDSELTEQVSNDSGATTTADPNVTDAGAEASGTDVATEPATDPGRPVNDPDPAAPPPVPTPTCWDEALGSHPEGIEDCEDD